MARAKSKAGRKGGAGRKKAASKRGGRKAGRKTSASRSKAGARKASTKRGRKTARGARAGRAGARATRKAARKASRPSGARGRKTRTGQTAATTSQGGEGDGEGGSQVEGEGSYTASRHFRKAQTGFVRRNRNRIPRMGKDAEAALEGPQGADLREAENEAKSHAAGEE